MKYPFALVGLVLLLLIAAPPMCSLRSSTSNFSAALACRQAVSRRLWPEPTMITSWEGLFAIRCSDLLLTIRTLNDDG